MDGECGELEQQTIYFASPEQLNDPMEGFRDIVWRGDKVVWNNLFKHYLYCLHSAYLSVKILGEESTFEPDLIPIWGRWDDPPTLQMGELFNEIWKRFCEAYGLSVLIDKIANTRDSVRYNKLLFYLDHAHIAALDIISEVHVDLGLAPETERQNRRSETSKSILADSDFFELIPQADTEVENFSEVMFSIVYQMSVARRLGFKYSLRNAHTGTLESNRQLLLFDFPTLYIEHLEKLLWPQWYAACFARSYHNSSLWARYGDDHRGVCLIFETAKTDGGRSLSLKQVTGWSSSHQEGIKDNWHFVPMTFRDVKYADRRGEIAFIGNMLMLRKKSIMDLWYTDGLGNTSRCASHVDPEMDLESWRKEHWDHYERDIGVKSRDWEHEQECRLILHGLMEDTLDDGRRTLTYDFESLKGIIFGIRTTDSDKIKVLEGV